MFERQILYCSEKGFCGALNAKGGTIMAQMINAEVAHPGSLKKRNPKLEVSPSSIVDSHGLSQQEAYQRLLKSGYLKLSERLPGSKKHAVWTDEGYAAFIELFGARVFQFYIPSRYQPLP